MLSTPSVDDSTRAHDGKRLLSKVSEQTFEPSVSSEVDKKALILPPTKKHWKPLTQKASFLVPTIMASVALIAVLQVYLERSNRDTGILFASKIDDLPLNQTFSYLYLPTIVSLVLSFIWTWIDLDIKRLQPYVQLSRQHGALGKDSILLHYPFDFVAFVPFAAIRRKHWSTFLASLAVVIIFWGLTPLQSSVFAMKTIDKTVQVSTVTSTSYLSLQDQKENLTGYYVQSSYNIAWLNESLPPFMNRQGILAPFSLIDTDKRLATSETWTAPTRYYSVDIDCEAPPDGEHSPITSPWGCSYDVKDMESCLDGIQDNQYSLTYVGYWYRRNFSYLRNGHCPKQENSTFLIRWGRGRQDPTNDTDSPYPLESSTLWCRPTYYQQDVNATVAPPSMSILGILPTGPKTPLPADLINMTEFEMSMNQGQELNNNRGPFPTDLWPSAAQQLHDKFPELYWNRCLSGMAGFALGAYQRPIADYLDPKVLKDSFEAAYRLLLARKLSDILSTDFRNGDQRSGTRHYSTQALIMVPTFVYVVEGLLGITVVAAVMILAIPSWRRTILTSEPANLAAMMALTSNDARLVQTMRDKDATTSHQLETLYQQTTFTLQETHQGPMLCCVDPPATIAAAQRSAPSRYILPMELSWYFGTGFLSLQCLIVAVLVLTYISANHNNGLSLPSASLLVNQILVKYLPMVVGAFFEPIFTWLTRTLCMLQPFNELRNGGTKPSRAITVDYDSRPPQAVIFRALKTGTLSLASICCIMTLLANLLSVAFSNILRERATLVYTPLNFTSEYTLPLNGSNFPLPTYDQYYIAISNLTAGTPLPAWTDNSFFYVPFGGFDLENETTALYQVRTPAVSVSLKCYPMYQAQHGNNLTWDAPVGGPGCNIPQTDEYVRSNVPDAIEYTYLGSHPPDCELRVFAGWGRSLTSHGPVNESWIGCKPELNVELRDVTVDNQGLVQSSTPAREVLDSQEHLFEPDASSFMSAVNSLLYVTNFMGDVMGWHNDSYPLDFFNFLMIQTLNNSAILDPLMPPPSFETTTPVFEELYTRMFAIVLGTHISEILQRANEKAVVAGFVLTQERRIFVSKPMFLIAVVILGTYMLVTLSLYVCRPWKLLPRMPTTIASQIAFFAASHGLDDFAITSSMSEKERNLHIKGLRRRYGFGKFVGTDGKTHIGIEREPLVQVLTKKDLRTKEGT